MLEVSLLKSYERFIRWAKRHERVQRIYDDKIYSEVSFDGYVYNIRFWIHFYMIGGYGLNPIEEESDKYTLWIKKGIKGADTTHKLYTKEVEKLRNKYPTIWVYVEKYLPSNDKISVLFLYLDDSTKYDEKYDVATMPPYKLLGWF